MRIKQIENELIELHTRIFGNNEKGNILKRNEVKVFIATAFFAGTGFGIMLGFFMPHANANPSCGGNGPSIDGTCQWWRNLPPTGQPGYSPGIGGPSFYQPCIGDAASKASSSCINGE